MTDIEIHPSRVPLLHTTCRICGSANLEFLYSLGTQYVSDFVEKDKVTSGVACPIDIVFCRYCTLVQQQWTAPQEFLYTRHYWYRSGVTQTMRRALRDVAYAAINEVGHLTPSDVVLDIGSNDGTLLRQYPTGIKIGVEPAKNLAEAGAVGLDRLIPNFWNAQDYDNEGWPKAKVVTAIGMFYDLDDPNAFIADVAKVLHPEGVFIAQLQCLKQTVELGDVGNLCHEHLEFYSLRSLRKLFYKHGLVIYKVEENEVNGGSYRIYARHYKVVEEVEKSVSEAVYKELSLDLVTVHRAFFAKACEERRKCVDFIRCEVSAGKRVWILGASTKGNVILQWYGLSADLIEAAADRSPEKWGKYTVGSGIPIKSEVDFRKANPDYALVLPYAFRDEFMEREKEWWGKGGRFIFPLPNFEVV